MRKKRSDTGTKRHSTETLIVKPKPTDTQIIKNALTFIENFENSGEEHIWIEGLKKTLHGEPL
jgi:hypothetical protein